MRNTGTSILSVRLPADLREWLRRRSSATGVPAGQIVREQLERARAETAEPDYMQFAGVFKGGAKDVSMRKGFSKG